jgi:hypothetical protein
VTVAPPEEHAATEPAEGACAQCGAQLEDDQEWCLECGSARTLIHRPPDWRVPLAVIGLVVAVALSAFVVVLVNLSSDANRRAALAAATATTATAPPTQTTTPTTPTTTQTTGTAAATTPLTTPNGTRLESWPAGLSGWTVVLATSHTEADAVATAQQIASKGIQVGVLDSSQHPRLAPGEWLVFTGRYPTEAVAEQVVAALQPIGESQAAPKLVARPGDQPVP